MTESISRPVKVSVIAPMHNEEGNLEALYEGIRAAMNGIGQPYEILFVNDGSTDRSLSLMRQIQDRDPCFHFVNLASNVGENWAMLAGISKARGEVLVTIDGDYQNDPAYIPALLEELSKGYRVVSGWRKKRVGGLWTRRFPSLIANGLIRLVSGVPVHDCGCGLKAYRREVLEGKYVPKGFMNRFSPVVLGVRGEEFSEIEIVDRPRKSGQSHYGLSRIFVVLRDLLPIPFAVRGAGRWLRRFRVLQWLAIAACVLFALGGWRRSAVGMLLLAALSFSNKKNLSRFLAARAKPGFDIREYR